MKYNECSSLKVNYNSIDVMKFICSILVLTIHIKPFAEISSFANIIVDAVICKIAVPFFFACTGYFFVRKMIFKNGKIKWCKENLTIMYKYVLRIFVLYFIWSAVYFIYIYSYQWFANGYFSIKDMIAWWLRLVYNESYGHLWYLATLIYAIPLLFVVLSVVKIKLCPIISVLLYSVELLFGSYSFVANRLGLSILVDYYKTFNIISKSVFRAVPLLLIGVVVLMLADKRLKLRGLLISLSVLICMNICEVFILYQYWNNTTFTHNVITTIPVSVIIILIVMRIEFNNKSINYQILRNMSTVIYCLHMLLIKIIRLMFTPKGAELILLWIVAVILSVLFAYLIVKLSHVRNFGFLKYLY